MISRNGGYTNYIGLQVGVSIGSSYHQRKPPNDHPGETSTWARSNRGVGTFPTPSWAMDPRRKMPKAKVLAQGRQGNWIPHEFTGAGVVVTMHQVTFSIVWTMSIAVAAHGPGRCPRSGGSATEVQATGFEPQQRLRRFIQIFGRMDGGG